MRKTIITLFVTLTLVIGATGVAPAAHADAPANCNTGDGTAGSTCCDDNYCDNSQGLTCSTLTYKCIKSATTPAATTGAAVTAAEKAAADTPTKIDSTDAAYNGVMIRIMGLFAWLVGVAAITLDNAVYYTVVTMGSYVSKLSAIGVAWRILRDMANIMLIFGFLGAGIATIIGVEQYGFGTKMLPKLLIAAVLINFSLFVSEAMIDGTNLLATQVYTQINGSNPAGAKNFDSVSAVINAADDGIASKIMGKLGLQTIYGDAVRNTAVFQGGNTWFIGFMSILLFIVTAFVMFSLAFILIARFVALIFLILVSPVAFMGWAVPWLEYRMNQWWTHFTEQIITAPVLLLLLYVALLVITDAQFLTGFCLPSASSVNASCTPNWTGFVSGNFTGFASMILSFLVAMGLLMIVVIKAKSMSAVGAGWATKWVGRATFGATAMGASAVTGGLAFGARRGIVQRFNPTSRFGRATQRLASRGLRKVEGVRMDVRRLPGVGAGMALAGVGDVAKPIERSAIGRVQQGVEWLRHGGDEANRQMDQETRIPRLRAALATNNHQEMGRILGSTSDKELENTQIQRLIANNPVAVAALAQNRFDKLLTSDTLSDAQKANLRTQRAAGLIARYSNVAEIQGLTNEAASQLPDAVLLQPVVHQNLNVRQLNAIYNAGRIQDATATTIGVFLQADPTFMAYFAGRNPQQQADLRVFWHIP